MFHVERKHIICINNTFVFNYFYIFSNVIVLAVATTKINVSYETYINWGIYKLGVLDEIFYNPCYCLQQKKCGVPRETKCNLYLTRVVL